MHWANKGKRNNPTHNSSVTKWHQSIFILLLLFCCVFYCCSASSCCSRKNSKIFAESSGNAKVAYRVSWNLFFTCRGMPPARAICILGTQNTKTTKSWQHLTYNFPADRTTSYLTPFPLRPCAPSALVVCCVFGMFHWQARLKYAAKSRAAPKTRSRWIQAEAVCLRGAERGCATGAAAPTPQFCGSVYCSLDKKKNANARGRHP